jgi:hypothetical protein
MWFIHAIAALVLILAATEALLVPALSVSMQLPDQGQAAMVSEMMMSTYAMCCTACAFFIARLAPKNVIQP